MSSFPSVHRAFALTCALLSCVLAFPTLVVASDEDPPDLAPPVEIVAIDSTAGRVSVALPGSAEIRAVEVGDVVRGRESSCPELTIAQVGQQAVRIQCIGALADKTVWLRRDAQGMTRLVVWSADAPVIEPSEPTQAPHEAERQ